ncbi:MAG: hypothetical protein RL553_427 [Planctomycetota bacterium]|jgi:hypothetical protein
MIQNIANSVQIWQNGLILTTTKIRGFEEYGCFFLPCLLSHAILVYGLHIGSIVITIHQLKESDNYVSLLEFKFW